MPGPLVPLGTEWPGDVKISLPPRTEQSRTGTGREGSAPSWGWSLVSAAQGATGDAPPSMVTSTMSPCTLSALCQGQWPTMISRVLQARAQLGFK